MSAAETHKDTTMKGCHDGGYCQHRNTCWRYINRANFAETLGFYAIYQPACQFKVARPKK